MCYSTWCMLITIASLVSLFFLTKDETLVGCNTELNQWTYENCLLALVGDYVLRLVILNASILPRIVFVKTE